MSPATDGSHGLVAVLADSDEARAVIDDLEDHGIPADAISMQAPTAERFRSEEEQTDKEAEAVGEVGTSVLVWALGGIVAGAAIGLLVTIAIGGWSLATGLLLGAVFGAAIGGAAGGMNVAKYASVERPNTYLAEGAGEVAVEVRHPDASVIDEAAAVLGDHPTVRVSRI